MGRHPVCSWLVAGVAAFTSLLAMVPAAAEPPVAEHVVVPAGLGLRDIGSPPHAGRWLDSLDDPSLTVVDGHLAAIEQRGRPVILVTVSRLADAAQAERAMEAIEQVSGPARILEPIAPDVLTRTLAEGSMVLGAEALRRVGRDIVTWADIGGQEPRGVPTAALIGAVAAHIEAFPDTGGTGRSGIVPVAVVVAVAVLAAFGAWWVRRRATAGRGGPPPAPAAPPGDASNRARLDW